MTRAEKQAATLDLANQIERELKKLGIWQTREAPNKPISGAFGSDSLTFEEWLQFVFLVNLKKAALSNTYPKSSNVAVAAVRNLDGRQGVEDLIDQLSCIDRLFER